MVKRILQQCSCGETLFERRQYAQGYGYSFLNAGQDESQEDYSAVHDNLDYTIGKNLRCTKCHKVARFITEDGLEGDE